MTTALSGVRTSVGRADGAGVGCIDGEGVGCIDGEGVGCVDGEGDGADDGKGDGKGDGKDDGEEDGSSKTGGATGGGTGSVIKKSFTVSLLLSSSTPCQFVCELCASSIPIHPVPTSSIKSTKSLTRANPFGKN